ncbi:maturation protein [ssRNA phage SRR5467091_7]|uniref:Maturation protein n=1 Tax=ssRNA phage SRR5467091_7 TaxID=2786472 RepID=A0A8S5L0D3_9VIRU|nr:maturation protein [ssRNA phage SRR5467091_7]DAD50903.1 TPA_asm: maturation protein [ssRNA phage SRR5467091_7]
MPHDAVSVNTITMGDVHKHDAHTSGYEPPGFYTIPDKVILYRNTLMMPASVNNPKDANGVRPISPYWIKRILIQARPRALTQVNPGPGVFWGWYTKESTSVFYMPAEFQISDPNWTFEFALAGPLVRTNVDALARTKFLNNLGNRSGKDLVELGVAAGELRETIGLVTELGSSTIKAIGSVAKGVSQAPGTIGKALYNLERLGFKETARRFFNGDTRLLEKVVESWLVYQLGIKPLAYDVYDAEVYLRSQVDQDYYHLDVAVKGGASTTEDVQLDHHTYGVNGSTFAIAGLYRQYTAIHYSCKYRIPTQANMSQQLGVNNPGYVAWNLARFTWIVDKVVDIGGWLHSFTGAQNTLFQEGTKSEIRRSSLLNLIDITDQYFDVGPVIGLNPMDPPLVQVEWFNREVLGSAVMPSFLPGVKNKMGLVQLASTVAALTTLSGSRVKWPNPGII